MGMDAVHKGGADSCVSTGGGFLHVYTNYKLLLEQLDVKKTVILGDCSAQ